MIIKEARAHLVSEGGFAEAPPPAKAHYLGEFFAVALITAFIVYAIFKGKK